MVDVQPTSPVRKLNSTPPASAREAAARRRPEQAQVRVGDVKLSGPDTGCGSVITTSPGCIVSVSYDAAAADSTVSGGRRSARKQERGDW
jgi:hypothetical protein